MRALESPSAQAIQTVLKSVGTLGRLLYIVSCRTDWGAVRTGARNRSGCFYFIQAERDGADAELHFDPELDRQAAGVVGYPKCEPRIAGVEYVVENIRFIAHSLE